MFAAIKDQDRILFAVSVGGGFSGVSEKDMMLEENVPLKVIDKESKTMIGFLFAQPDSDIFLCDDEFLKDEISAKSIVLKTIPYIKKRLMAEKWATNGRWLNSITIAKGDKLFDVSPTYVFREINDVVCHGAANVVEAAYARLKRTENMSAIERISDVFSFVESIGDKQFPIAILDNATGEVTFMKKEGAVCL